MSLKKIFSVLMVICFVSSTVHHASLHAARSKRNGGHKKENLYESVRNSMSVESYVQTMSIASLMVMGIMFLLDDLKRGPACSVLRLPGANVPEGFALIEGKTLARLAWEKGIPTAQLDSFLEKGKNGKLDNDSVIYRFHEIALNTCVAMYVLQKKEKPDSIKKMCSNKPKNLQWQNTVCLKKKFDTKQNNFKYPRGNQGKQKH